MLFSISAICGVILSSCNNSEAKKVSVKLENELSLIVPMDNITLIKHYVSTGRSKVLLEDSYSTSKPFTNVSKYYDAQLLKHGWQFRSEKEIKNWPSVDVIIHRTYSKNNFIANFDYSKSQTYNWTFTLAFSWGLYDNHFGHISSPAY